MTGTIQSAKRDESEGSVWSNEHGTFHRWLVSIQAGDETINTSVNRKVKDGQSKSPQGEPAEQKPDGKWKVAAAQGGGNSGGGKSYEADPRKMRGENARSALHAAKDLVVADKLPLGELPDTARRFYTFIDEKASPPA